MLQILLDALIVGSLYAVVALGVTLLIGIMGLVNFAYGELIMIGGYVVFLGLSSGWPLPLTLVVVLVSVVVLALLQERVAFRPIRGADPTTLLVTSFALSYLLQALTTMITGAKPIGIPSIVDITPREIWGLRISDLDVLTVATAIAILVALALLLKYTTLGLQMRAAAEDFGMARLLGSNSNFIISVAFAVGGVLAAATAVLLTARTGTITPTSGQQLLLIAFVATVIGGMGSLGGAVIGSYLLAFITSLLQHLLPVATAPFRDAIAFLIVIAVLVTRPQGLSRSRSVRV